MADKLSAGDVAIQILSHYAVPFVSAREEKVEVATQLIDQAITGATLRIQEYAAELADENKRLHHELIETTDSRAALFTERRKLEARLTAAREVLKALEWVNFQGAKYCPKCAEWERVGHAPDCTLDAVLNPKEKA